MIRKQYKRFTLVLFLVLIIPVISNLNSFLNFIPVNDSRNKSREINDLRSSDTDHPAMLLWDRKWRTGGSQYDRAYDSVIDPSDNVYLVGYLSTPYHRLLVLKYDSDGNELLQFTWGSGSTGYHGRSIALDSSGNIYAAGDTSNGPKDAFLVKFDSNGNYQWHRTWGGITDEKCDAIALDSLGNIYIGGYTESYGAGGQDIFLVKYNNLGVKQWDLTWGGSGNEYCGSICIDDSDTIYIGGTTYSFGAGVGDMCVIKFDTSGNQLLNTTWGTTKDDWCNELRFDNSNNFFLLGTTQPSNVDICLVKFNSAMVYQWNITYGEGGYEYGECIAFDSYDDIYVGGYTSLGVDYDDYYLLKFDKAGVFQWSQKSNWLVDRGYNIDIDSKDDIYLSGYSYSGTWWNHLRLMKFRESPFIKINLPEKYAIFGNESPTFSLSISAPHLNTSWYSLNDGANNTFSGNEGTLNQALWDNCSIGFVRITFYINCTLGKFTKEQIIIRKIINWEDYNNFTKTIEISKTFTTYMELDPIARIYRDRTRTVKVAFLIEGFNDSITVDVSSASSAIKTIKIILKNKESSLIDEYTVKSGDTKIFSNYEDYLFQFYFYYSYSYISCIRWGAIYCEEEETKTATGEKYSDFIDFKIQNQTQTPTIPGYDLLIVLAIVGFSLLNRRRKKIK